MKITIIYQDDDLLVIEKPAGVVVNRAESVKVGTIQDWAERRLKAQPRTRDFVSVRGRGSRLKAEGKNSKFKEFYERRGIVHRLDKETSGLLIIAKNAKSFEDLQRQFKERGVEKRYLALVHGEVKPSEGEIRAPVGRLPWNRERFGVFPGGREARTKYKIVSYYYYPRCLPISTSKVEDKVEDYSLVEVIPYTGRTHQIRVHLKYLGHPIVGDSFYAGRKRAVSDRKWCPRLFLHANYLRFSQPTTARWVKVESKLLEELDEALNKLKIN